MVLHCDEHEWNDALNWLNDPVTKDILDALGLFVEATDASTHTITISATDLDELDAYLQDLQQFLDEEDR